MGSLERVQYKFASIIGELCSDPIVLSQFAVWLDLKLAEYKAKGSISLDCSGEKPEPPWMKGVLPSSPPSSLFEHKNPEDDIPLVSSSFRNPVHRTSAPYSSTSRVKLSPSVTSPSQPFSTDELSQRLSSDEVVLIKDEPSESVYPTNLYPNELSTHSSDSFSDIRKRHVQSDIQQSFTPKVRRMVPTSASGSPSSASNQSNPGGIRESPSHDPTGSLDDPMLVPSSHNQAAESTSQSSWLGQVTAERDSDMSGLEADEVTPEGDVIANVSVWSPDLSLDATREIPSYHYTQPKTQSSSLQRHIIAAGKKFHHWLSQRNPTERREMHRIPPAELDAYLAEYFSRVKQTSGGDYNAASFGNLRSCLDHNLRNHNYPYSMSRSIEFALSQKVFKERKFKMAQAAKQTTAERPQNPTDN